MWAQIFNIGIGLFLMFVPSLWSFDKADSNHYYIIGPLIITNAIIAIWEFNRGMRWLNVLIGAWLLVSPFVLESKGIVAGMAIVSAIPLILFSLFKGGVNQRYGGGWSSLFQKNPVHLEEASEHKVKADKG